MHTVVKVDCFLLAAICVSEYGEQPDVYRSRGIKVRVRTGRKGIAHAKEPYWSGAGTEMAPVDTWVIVELLVKVCVHVPEAK